MSINVSKLENGEYEISGLTGQTESWSSGDINARKSSYAATLILFKRQYDDFVVYLDKFNQVVDLVDAIENPILPSGNVTE